MSFSRPSGRAPEQMRAVSITRGYTRHAEGSVLVAFGDTRVLCTASVENRVPGFLRGKGEGWITAEYGMLPRATHTRGDREAARGKQGGRTLEIQRLIGRSLRACVDRAALGERQQGIQLVAAERMALGGALQFDEAATVVHHHVHVGVAVAVLGVVEVEHRHAAIHPGRHRRDRADDRVPGDLLLRPQPAHRVHQRDIGAGDGGGAGAAVGLQDVAVEGDGALAERGCGELFAAQRAALATP